ncbi:MAG: tRNA pseudouridine(55) synthase TruB [Thermodesulfovibrionales bacterium]
MHVVINLNKPKGLTSNDALIRVKKAMKIRKAGHAGTLDPLATGVLLIGTNEATKILPYLLKLDKEYLFTARLGVITDTYDSEGNIIEERDIGTIDINNLLAVLENFQGQIVQKPPAFSALKHKGKPLYEYARKGINIESKEREINIQHLELIDLSPPFASFKAVCSSGTYIRSLCHDIGMAMGTGAHIISLTRTRIGNFTLQNSLNLEDLPHARQGFINIDNALQHVQSIVIDKNLQDKVRKGEGFSVKNNSISQEDTLKEGYVRIIDHMYKTFAIGWFNGNRVTVKRLLHV